MESRYQYHIGTISNRCLRIDSIGTQVPYQIDVVKPYGFSYGFFYLFDIDFSLTNKSWFWKMEITFIRYFIFCTFQKMYLKKFSWDTPKYLN